MTMLPSARNKEVTLDLDVEPGLGVVAADAGQLDRLLLNLLSERGEVHAARRPGRS